MFLPKPSAFTLPTGAAPEGLGIQACNSGNSCRNNTCDINKPDDSCGAGFGVGAGILAGAAAAAL